jgi:Uma2 family endonuclease
MSNGIELSFAALDRLPTAAELPYDDGEPMETAWHRPAMNVLIESIECHWQGRKDFFVGGNMFMYFSRERVFHKDFRGPDFFVVTGVDHDRERLSWVAWEENSRLPNVIIELSFESTAETDRVLKKKLYGKTLQTPEYYVYDPGTDELIGWRRENGGYKDPIEPEDGRLWSKELELYVGPWTGEFQGHRRRWLRFFDVHGKLIPTFGESEKKWADQKTRLANKAQQQAQNERQRADAEARRAAEEKARADAEARKAVDEKVRADAAVAELDQLRRKIAALRQQPPS